ncbi:peptide deformylase [Alicyclobacillus dauci]|uniref:Peptide deformylase n=1 Tax=Alicyclobacillus dauci TaxID=1475485 RepID=A0ABY6YY08_9BACL|nr:peptide deformylase [Alicyclobacillus dauci]WAH35498.1 peptide deformylase [Alicyclobacillus dauci]
MAIRIIRKGEDEALRQKAKEVTKFTPAIHKLLDDMAETMRDADGVGLAANQIGILKRLIVMDVGQGLIELVNPEVIEKHGSQYGPEGCLSLPGISGKVERANYIRIRAQNRYGEPFELEGRELLARCIQHEMDHLDGILFTDYLRPDEIERVTVEERS